MSSEIKTQLQKAYDKDAERRDSKEIDKWKADLREKFLKVLKSEEKITLLELGSGTGRDALYFKENGFDVLASDFSEGMIIKCKEKGLNAVTLDLYDLSDLDNKFDAVFSLNVLLHVPRKDLPKVLLEIAKVLNPGGVFYFGVYGGFDSEEVFTDASKMNMPRFFLIFQMMPCLIL